MLLSEQNRFALTAKSTGARTLVELLRSFTKKKKKKKKKIKRKSKSPSVGLRGTPRLTIFISVLKSSYKVNCFLSAK